MKVGVPQGTIILGLLLFVIYTNDLVCLLRNNLISSYADDTIVVSFGQTRKIAELVMSLYLKIVCKRLISNQLSLNTAKTLCIALELYVDSIPLVNISVNDKPIENVEFCKYLGVLLVSNFRWNVHINYILCICKGRNKEWISYLPILHIMKLHER